MLASWTPYHISAIGATTGVWLQSLSCVTYFICGVYASVLVQLRLHFQVKSGNLGQDIYPSFFHPLVGGKVAMFNQVTFTGRKLLYSLLSTEYSSMLTSRIDSLIVLACTDDVTLAPIESSLHSCLRDAPELNTLEDGWNT